MFKPAFLLKAIATALPYRLLLTGTFVLISFFSIHSANAQGDLLVTPRRVVFEGGKNTQELNLANTGRDTVRYLISMIDIRMKEDGTFEEISQPDPGQNFANDYLRFFPRSVTLGPGEAQVVKVQLKNTAKLTNGEYRSHIYFRAVPEEKPLGEVATAKAPSTISVHLTPIFGISIPAIIRVGKSTSEVRLSDLSLQAKEDTTSLLSFSFNRLGNMSVYGDINVEFTSTTGKTTQVAVAKGVAIYTPNLSRRFQIDLPKKKGIDYKEGTFHVVYTAQSNNEKTETIAEAFMSVTTNSNIAKAK